MKNVETYKIRFVTRFKFNVTNARYAIIGPKYFLDFFRFISCCPFNVQNSSYKYISRHFC